MQSKLHRPGEFKLLKAGRLIDGLGGKPIKDGAVLLEGPEIRAIGSVADIRPPEGAKVESFDFPGKTIMPGMIDCHTHHNGFGDGRFGEDIASLPDEILALQSARNAETSLLTGVTTIRENGPKNMTMFRLRESINEGITKGPRMVLCGRPISIIGGHMGYFGSEVTGQNEARAMVRQLIKEGADYIKISATGGTTRTSFPLRQSFNVDELTAMTEEARKFHKLTATHCVSTEGIKSSLDAGVDMIIHCYYREPDGKFKFRQDLAERIGEQGVSVNPTIHVSRARIWALQAKQLNQKLSIDEQKKLDDGLRAMDIHLEYCRRMINMGLPLITGSDSSWGDYKLGNVVYETECLVMAGYSPMEGVLSITSAAARAIGVADTVGSLEPGKAADIIIVDGDPSRDIKDLWKINEVFQNGRRVDRGTMSSREAFRQYPPPKM